MDQAVQNLQRLVKEEKWEEFRKEFDKWLDTQASAPSDPAKDLLNMAELSVRLKSSFNQKYLKELDELIEQVKKLEKKNKDK